MKITYKDKEYELKYSFRALMIYENITGTGFNPKTLSDLITFYFSLLLSATTDEQIDFNEFLDWLDEDPSRLNDFSVWLSEVFKLNDLKSPIKKEQTKEKKEDKDNSKNL